LANEPAAKAFTRHLGKNDPDEQRCESCNRRDSGSGNVEAAVKPAGERRDLVIDGSVEGLIQLDERKLTVGTTATVVADITADEVVVYAKMKGNVRARAGSR
jgi:hypothetical protein